MVGGAQELWIYDTTLRDGTQQVGISLSLRDKLKLLERLDDFGVDYVEGGWPGSNRKDLEFFAQAAALRLHTRLVAFGATRRAHTAVERDSSIEALLAAQTPTVTVFGKSWDLHVHEALGTTLEENLAMIRETVAYLKAQGKVVIYDAEHFFDGAASDHTYALETLAAATEGGADWLVLCDSNGGSFPEVVAERTREVVQVFDRPVGIHTHDDGGLGVANAIAAVRVGARQVQGTINGYGERCGNANLCTLLPNLVLKYGYQCRAAEHLGSLTSLSHVVSEICNMPPVVGAPFVGPNAFAHKGGIHVSAVNRNPRTYEHITPEAVGNDRKVVVSELSGKSNLVYKAKELGIDWLTTEARNRLLERVKELEYLGYQFEGAEASFELLARRTMGSGDCFFAPLGYLVQVRRAEDGVPESEANVRLRVGGELFHTAASGDGPVNALDRALRKALVASYPEIARMHLEDYKVRVIDGKDGTASRVRVLITTGSGGDAFWTTVGVSDNILDASWLALIDSLEYGLWREHGAAPVVPLEVPQTSVQNG